MFVQCTAYFRSESIVVKVMLCVGIGKHIFLFLIELVGDHTHVHTCTQTLDSVLHLNFTFRLSDALEPDPEKPVCIYKTLHTT